MATLSEPPPTPTRAKAATGAGRPPSHKLEGRLGSGSIVFMVVAVAVAALSRAEGVGQEMELGAEEVDLHGAGRVGPNVGYQLLVLDEEEVDHVEPGCGFQETGWLRGAAAEHGVELGHEP